MNTNLVLQKLVGSNDWTWDFRFHCRDWLSNMAYQLYHCLCWHINLGRYRTLSEHSWGCQQQSVSSTLNQTRTSSLFDQTSSKNKNCSKLKHTTTFTITHVMTTNHCPSFWRVPATAITMLYPVSVDAAELGVDSGGFDHKFGRLM